MGVYFHKLFIIALKWTKSVGKLVPRVKKLTSLWKCCVEVQPTKQNCSVISVLVINSALLWSSHIIHVASCGNSKQVFYYRNFMLCFTNIKSVSVVVCSVKQFSKPLCMFSVRDTFFILFFPHAINILMHSNFNLGWSLCFCVVWNSMWQVSLLNQGYHVLKYLQLQNCYGIICTWLTLLSRQITWNLIIDTCTI